MLNNSSILITGGTGSFGNAFIPMTLEKFNPRRIVVFSRDEMKQWDMAKLFKDDPRMLNLDNWIKLEKDDPTIFSSMYQFFLYKKYI